MILSQEGGRVVSGLNAKPTSGYRLQTFCFLFFRGAVARKDLPAGFHGAAVD